MHAEDKALVALHARFAKAGWGVGQKSAAFGAKTGSNAQRAQARIKILGIPIRAPDRAGIDLPFTRRTEA